MQLRNVKPIHIFYHRRRNSGVYSFCDGLAECSRKSLQVQNYYVVLKALGKVGTC